MLDTAESVEATIGRITDSTVQHDDVQDTDLTLKARHRAMWALGDYPALAAEIIPDLGTVLVDAAWVQPGDRVLDVAARTGNAPIRAAQT
ncbi:hypothetical protein [Arthrobacter sp. HLT1-21]